MQRSRLRSENSVSVALGRLRGGTQLACWLLGLALLVHVAVWSLAYFTDMRYEDAAPARADSSVVVAPQQSLSEATAAPEVEVPPTPERTIDADTDRMFRAASSFSGGVGTLALIMLVPLLGLGVVVAAGSATPGVEHTVSAFAWALILAVLVLPVGTLVAAVPNWSSFTGYETMIAQVEAYQSGAEYAPNAVAFFGRFLIIPVTALFASILIGLRFSAGVEAARMPREPILDPELEAEAGNISATSLHGGRMAGALRTISDDAKEPSTKKQKPEELPNATKVPAGKSPSRII